MPHEAIRLFATMAAITISLGSNHGFDSYFSQRMEDFLPLDDEDIPNKLFNRNSNDE